MQRCGELCHIEMYIMPAKLMSGFIPLAFTARCTSTCLVLPESYMLHFILQAVIRSQASFQRHHFSQQRSVELQQEGKK